MRNGLPIMMFDSCTCNTEQVLIMQFSKMISTAKLMLIKADILVIIFNLINSKSLQSDSKTISVTPFCMELPFPWIEILVAI